MSVELSNDVLSIEKVTAVESTHQYIPNVIEPSFGIGCILTRAWSIYFGADLKMQREP